jgi:hypothetical protein
MRTTRKFLEAQVNRLNGLFGLSGVHIFRTDADGKVIGGNPGVYYIDGAYGGYALHRMTASGGTGVDDIFSGHKPAAELSGLISAFINGIETERESKV